MSAGLPPTSAEPGFAAGLRAGMPVVLGYLPAAFAFGAAAVAAGFAPGAATAVSAIVFSGANQVFLLAALAAGTPLAVVAGLGALAGLRHILYGLVLRRRIGGTRGQRLAFAFGLTDEVFAVALGRTQEERGPADVRPGGGWLIGLALSAWGAWVAGTLAGAVAGGAVAAMSERAAAAMAFALPALFLALAMSAARRAVAGPMLLAAVVAGGAVATGHGDLAIPLGALAAFAARRARGEPA